MSESWVTPEWADRQAERMEADARRMRALAEILRAKALTDSSTTTDRKESV